MHLKINKVSLWVVHLLVLLNIIFLIADFTLTKKEEEIFLEHVYTKGTDSRRSKKQVIIEFNNFTIYGNNGISKILDKSPENRYYLLKNNFLNNKAFVKVVYRKNAESKQVFVGYHCYNPYFVYLLFLTIPTYFFLLYNAKKNDFMRLIPYFAIPIGIVFFINIIVQF